MSEHESAKVQAKEKMLEALFEYAAACHVENIIAENPIEDDSAPDFALPPEFDRKMKKLIARHDNREGGTAGSTEGHSQVFSRLDRHLNSSSYKLFS